MTQAEALERAILARAERLAGEFRDRAKRSSDSILREAAERLRLREQREEAIAKTLGDRTFRQQVQAEELRMQSLLDRTRWDLVTQVEAQLVEQMQALMAKETVYLKTLREFIATAATEMTATASLTAGLTHILCNQFHVGRSLELAGTRRPFNGFIVGMPRQAR